MKIKFLIILIMLILFSGCTSKKSLNIMVASDLHYLSKELYDNGSLFTAVVTNSDGKVMTHIEDITNSFIEEVIKVKPDVLLLTGDLSFNGELLSHQDLASKLKQIEENDINVLVLPGNHDLNFYQAVQFKEDTYSFALNTSRDQFKDIYNEFGYKDAISIDEDSLSYITNINDEYEVLMLDISTEDNYCSFSDNTYEWIKTVLEDATSNDKKVLLCMHENLLQHSIFKDGYVVERQEELLNVLNKHHVELCLSGHMHIQHIKQQNGITEITTSSLALHPFQYGMLSIGKTMTYEAKPLIITTDINNFDEYAISFMFPPRDNKYETLQQYDLDEDTINAMVEYSNRLHIGYFNGNMTAFSSQDEMYQRWINLDATNALYMSWMEPDLGKDYTKWSNK